MKDETFTFIETVKERADPARSAFKKGKHKGCILPHENLTRKELNKMNGEINTINLNKPMKWAEFKALDNDIQQRYIKRLRDLYNASVDALAGMFGLYPNTVHKMFRIMGLADGKRHRMTWQQKCAFEAFCNDTAPDPVPEEKPIDIPEETIQEQSEMLDLSVPEKDADGRIPLRFHSDPEEVRAYAKNLVSSAYKTANEAFEEIDMAKKDDSDVPPIDEPVARLSTASFSYHNIDKASVSVLSDLLKGYIRALPGTYKVTIMIEEE